MIISIVLPLLKLAKQEDSRNNVILANMFFQIRLSLSVYLAGTRYQEVYQINFC
jgi:hypothetical protein